MIERLSDEGGYEFVWLEQEHGSGDWAANDAVVVRARGELDDLDHCILDALAMQ